MALAHRPLQIGSVIRIILEHPPELNKPKYFIIVGDFKGVLALVIVNTEQRIDDYLIQLQSSQLPINPRECPFLEHDSYVDCADLFELNKTMINNIIVQNPGRHQGDLPAEITGKIIDTILRAKTISPATKATYWPS